MKKILLFLLLAVLCSNLKSQNIEANWESIKTHSYPQWFNDAKLGIFIHWGLYSVPAYCGKEQYAEWLLKGVIEKDPNRMAFLKKLYGDDFKYEDLDKHFRAELFNPDEWADLFKKSGAKYVVLVTKHHDGYCLWDSKYAPNWNSVSGGPKRDIVSELTKSVREKNLIMGFYYSLPEWNNPLHRWYYDSKDDIEEYVSKHMIPQFKELVSAHKPELIFSDGEWLNTSKQWHAEEIISWYYNLVGPKAIVNNRWGEGSDYGFKTPEYSAGITDTTRPWAECRGLGRSFGLNRNEPLDNYVTSNQLIAHFVKLVAAGGGMTLNVGPAADGQIPLLQQERLIDLGKWLSINSEAIYGTRPYHKFYEYKNVSLNRIDSNIDFNWKRNSPDPQISYDNFTATWQGYISPKYSEKYKFDLKVDDDAKLFIDNKEINIQKAEEIKLKAGEKYQIRLEYSENDLEAEVHLYWESKSQEKEIINEKSFFIDNTSSKNGLKAEYKCKQPYICYTTKGEILYAIALDYPQDELILEIPKADSQLRIRLLGCDKDLNSRYVDGKLIIDTSPIKYNDIKSSIGWTFKIEEI